MKALRNLSLVLSVATIATLPMFAADPLEEWGQRTAPGSGYVLNAVAFGNGVFVAVGGAGTILTSADGANWSNTSPGNYGPLRTVKFLNGEFMAVGETNRFFRSADGSNWTISTLPSVVNWDVAYGNGLFLVLSKNGFLPEAYVSNDATNWTPAAPRRLVDPNTGTTKVISLACVAFGAGEFVAMPRAVSYPQERGVFHSSDGINWTLTSGPYDSAAPPSFLPEEIGKMTYVNGLFVIASSWQNFINSSSNGVDWVGSPSLGGINSSMGPMTGIACGANYFIDAGSSGGQYRIIVSTNCTSWDLKKIFSDVAFNGAAFGNDTFVVVGGAGTNPAIYQSSSLGGAPTILTEPLDRDAVVSNSVTFSVVAGGSQPLTFQWQKDGSLISGATSSTFVISNVVATNAGGYSVIVTNSFGSVTSRVAQLTVSFLQIQCYAGLTILGTVGQNYRIDAAPAASGPWTPITGIVLPQSPYIWIDYASPSFTGRFYRVVEVH